MRGARAQKCTIDGTTFDSIAEACFYCWCKEAKELGVLKGFQIQPEYKLTDPVKYVIKKQLKTKVKDISRTLLQGSSYTADYNMGSYQPIEGLFSAFVGSGDPCGYVIDIKGAHQPPGSAAKFSLTQKVLYAMRGIYVNKVVIAYDTKKYSPKKASTGFFANHGVPEQLPTECYQRCGTKLYAVWSRMFSGLPSIREVYG